MEIATYTLSIRSKILKTEFLVNNKDGSLFCHGEWDFWRKTLYFEEVGGTSFTLTRKGIGHKISFIMEKQGMVYGTVFRKKKLFSKNEFYLNIGELQYMFRSIKSYKHLAIWHNDTEVGRLSCKRKTLWLKEFGLAIDEEHFDPRMFCMLLALDRYQIKDHKQHSG